jgi:predicted ATPase
MAGFQNVRIQRFKNLNDTPFDLRDLNVIVGGNNSGKSSILQAIHFAIGAVQTLRLDGRLAGTGPVTTTVNPSQLIYVPSEDVHALGAGGRLWEPDERSVKIEFTLGAGETLSVSMRKGRNRNILITVSNQQVATRIGTIEHPFTVFTPGLAGIVKTEQYVSDGVLLRTIARGDANLVLRNTLLRLWSGREQSQQWAEFLTDLHTMFPQLEVTLSFAAQTDEYIGVMVNDGGGTIPLELSGTGILQAVQILSYIHYFGPQVIVLDEPDSHLHPNNQRLLCALLRDVAQTRNIQVILSTHSRHVLDALHQSASFLWVRRGAVERTDDGSDLAVLLDLGALDVKERIGAGARVCVVLTEDERAASLRAVVEASGFDMGQTDILPYYGCTSPHNLRPLINTIRGINANATVIVHMDRDYHTDEEINAWSEAIRALHAEPFVTNGVDIESHLLSADHLAAINQIERDVAQDVVSRAVQASRDESIRKYVNGRCDIAKKQGVFGRVDLGQLAVTAPQEYDRNPLRYAHSKTVMARTRELYRAEQGRNLVSATRSEHIASPVLEVVARRVFGNMRG